MNVISLGYYPCLIGRVVDKMNIQPGQSILDLGSGTGRNDCFIARKISPDGNILGLDISKEMISLSRKRCRSYPNVNFGEQRVEMPLTYEEEFDRIFISFVLHGFEDAQKVGIISNAYHALKPGGSFASLTIMNSTWIGYGFPFAGHLSMVSVSLLLNFSSST
jgi:demethylmenaquinone methyltransferase/2-methoxy-6-polyprenyl-1,4-benzoquinol methylase